MKTILKLNSRYYTKDAIERTISDFSEICDASILDDMFLVEIIPKQNILHISEEFANYSLALMKNERILSK